MNTHRIVESILSRAVLTVATSTILLTAALVGIAVIVDGRMIDGFPTRLPVYVLVFALAFIVSLLKLDNRNRDGMQILVATCCIGIATTVLVSLATEGGLYLTHEPKTLLRRGLIAVFLAAGIVCTGLGIWGVRHWREFVGGSAYTSSKTVSEGGLNDIYK